MESRLHFFLNNHLKSLFISKFNLHKKEISKIGFKSILIKLKFLRKEHFSLDLKWLFFFFLTSQWPLIKIKYYFLRGKKILKLTSLDSIVRNNLIYVFLDKLVLLSLINYESWPGAKNLFKTNLKGEKNLKELTFLIFNLSIFWEFEYLSSNPLKVIKKETEDSLLVIKFIFYNSSLIKNLNILRALQIPVFFENKTKF